MKATYSFKARSLILAAALSAGLGFGSPAFGQVVTLSSYLIGPNGEVTKLESLGAGHTIASGINDAGQVVGSSGAGPAYIIGPQVVGSLGSHAFITGPNGKGITDLGTLGGSSSSAAGINDAGQVVGESETAGGGSHAFITGAGGKGMTDLRIPGSGNPDVGEPRSSATGINNAGQVVGWAFRSDEDHSGAFITGPNGRDITGLGARHATAINDAGQVVGWLAGGDDFAHAFITGPDGSLIDLDPRDNNYPGQSLAFDINDAGQVVGDVSSFRGGGDAAFITGPDGAGIRFLEAYKAHANAINDAGQVVGSYEKAGVRHAFITGPDGRGVTDLNSLVDLPDGVVLTGATGINNLGQVIAFSAIIPEPASYALMLAGLALVGFMARSKKQRV